MSGKVPLQVLALPRERKSLAARLVEKFGIKALNPVKALLVELSGGNQQKVVLAKGLSHKPLVAIIDEPTRGVDVGAIEEIHDLINGLANDGVAVGVLKHDFDPCLLTLSECRTLEGGSGHQKEKGRAVRLVTRVTDERERVSLRRALPRLWVSDRGHDDDRGYRRPSGEDDAPRRSSYNLYPGNQHVYLVLGTSTYIEGYELRRPDQDVV